MVVHRNDQKGSEVCLSERRELLSHSSDQRMNRACIEKLSIPFTTGISKRNSFMSTCGWTDFW